MSMYRFQCFLLENLVDLTLETGDSTLFVRNLRNFGLCKTIFEQMSNFSRRKNGIYDVAVTIL